MDAPAEIFQLKVRLLGISPMIWRRVLVPCSFSLREIHGVLQVAMGWEGFHLFAFDIHAVQYGPFELSMADPRLPLSQFDFRKNEKFSYVYDMGDHWEHEIRVEDFAVPDDTKNTPPVSVVLKRVRLKIAAIRMGFWSLVTKQLAMTHGSIWA